MHSPPTVGSTSENMQHHVIRVNETLYVKWRPPRQYINMRRKRYSVYVLNQAHRQYDLSGCECILTLGTRLRSAVSLMPQATSSPGKVSGAHAIGFCVVPTACLDATEKLSCSYLITPISRSTPQPSRYPA
jgi:hypothetical protein